MSSLQRRLDRVRVRFDDDSLVADAGLLLVGMLMSRLGMEQVIDDTVRLGGRPAGARPGRKVLLLVASMLIGGSHIDHADRLRAGATGRVLPFRVVAPSTLGSFLRSFTWGHVRQLNKALETILKRAWSHPGVGPGGEPLVIDVDSTVCEVHGKQKEGARWGYTHQLGYHPLVATRADTGEIVGARLRHGASRKGHTHFIAETVRRVRRAGATGEIIIRADAGFWSYKLTNKLADLGVDWSITVPQNTQVRASVEAIGEDDWTDIGYTPDGEAGVADTLVVTGQKRPVVRLIARRSRLTDPHQRRLWPDWRYHIFATSLNTDPVEADLFHRAHATCELAIRDIKTHSGLSHLPSGKFPANAAWLLIATLSHNMYRWTEHHSRTAPARKLVCGNTVRIRLFRLPGRIVNHGRTLILRLPAHWPWAGTYHTTLANLRALPQLC